MRISVFTSAFVAVLVGFGGSVAIVISAAQAVNATQAQTASWIAALCVAMAATTAHLSISSRKPMVTAWSTPGAALIATTIGFTIHQAVGAFIICAMLIILTALVQPLARLIKAIPPSIASAILAGILFPFVTAAIKSVGISPALGLPLIAAFFIIRMYSPSWAVIAVLAMGIALSFGLNLVGEIDTFALSKPVFVSPEFGFGAALTIALPLYFVTMASQNLPGFAVLKADGYAPEPSKTFVSTGVLSLLTAVFGAHTTSLAAITASICTGKDAHPDPEKRWLCGPVYAALYAVLALCAASCVALFASFPVELVAIIAGVALLGPLVNSVNAAVQTDSDKAPAVVAFAVTASGVSFAGIGAAFWGLVAGIILVTLNRLRS